MKAISAETMAEIDREAQEIYGISQIVLMENAGRSAAEVILAENCPLKNERIAIFCGKGNNGGDGFVVARYIANRSPGSLTVYAADMENIRTGAPRDNFNIIRKIGINIRPITDFLEGERPSAFPTIGVDAIFGTGFRGELPEEYAAISSALIDLNIRTYAIDVPSGLNATTGTASKGCFKSLKTITFAMPKQGFFVKDGPDFCGEIVVKDIGFPVPLMAPYM